MCGKPAEPTPLGSLLCPACCERYGEFLCGKCSERVMYLHDFADLPGIAAGLCCACHADQHLGTLTDQQREQLDALILDRKILMGMKRIREALGVRIHEAIDIYQARYRHLRAERPDEFSCSDKEYWEGFYS
jgi:hypothetical protein